MPKTKISEFSATPGNNTDIDGINIAEGCAPSGINDAIRELMAQLKDFQAGTAGDSFNGPIGSTTPAAGTFTNLSASGTFALTGDQVQISEGGTGQTTANAAFNALAPSQSTHAGKYLKTDGTNTSWDALDISTADITGTLPVANGGTGVTSSTGTGSVVLSASPTFTGTVNGAALTLSSSLTLSGGTANGVAYLNGSKVLTTGSALNYDGTNLTVSNAGAQGFEVRPNSGDYSGGINLFSYNRSTSAWAPMGSFASYFAWQVNASEQARLTSTGLGIGTSSPAFRLQVANTAASNFVSVVSVNTGTAGLLLGDTDSATVGRVEYENLNNAMTFFTNGSEKVRLDSSGNLGIGTSSPVTKLNIASAAGSPTGVSAGAIRVYETTNNYGLNIGGDGTYGYIQGLRGTTSTLGYNDLVLQPNSGNVGIGTSSPGAKLDVWGSSGDQIRVRTASTEFYRFGRNNVTGAMEFYGSQSGFQAYTFGGVDGTWMTINASGNLGLGVTPNSTWRSGHSVIQLGGGTGMSLASGTGTGYGLFQNYYLDNAGPKYANNGFASAYYQFNGAHVWFTAPSGTAGNAISFTQAMTLDASGNLGVGTTSPSTRLHVFNSTTTQLQVQMSGQADMRVISDTGYGALSLESNMPLILRTNATERARITSGGDLLVGTTSLAANERLNVVKATASSYVARVENSNNASGDQVFRSVLGTNANNTSSYHFVGTTGGTDRFYVFGNGNVQNTNNSYGAISDIKLKENITDATPKLASLNQLRVVNYNLKGDTLKQIGLVAQEVEQVFPGLVETSADRDAEGNDLGTTTKSVKYSVLVPMLLKAVQELTAMNDDLRARVAQLEAK